MMDEQKKPVEKLFPSGINKPYVAEVNEDGTPIPMKGNYTHEWPNRRQRRYKESPFNNRSERGRKRGRVLIAGIGKGIARYKRIIQRVDAKTIQHYVECK